MVEIDRFQQQQQQRRALQQWHAWSSKRRSQKLMVGKGELWWDLRRKEGGVRRWGGEWCEGRREGRRVERGMEAWYEQRLQQRGVRWWLGYVARRREERAGMRRGEGWREGGRRGWGKWCRMLGRRRERRRGEEGLLRAAVRVFERRRKSRALVGRGREGWV